MTESLKILHVLRAPVGGLFRHVGDVARHQAAAGHDVGVVCCSQANDRLTEQRLAELTPHLSLGLKRIAMAREIDWRDVTATRDTVRHAAAVSADVLHGHGAKGGAYARLAAARLKQQGARVVAVYTPHGGALHYAPTSIKGRIFMALERHLAAKTDGIIFESAYSSRIYTANVKPTSDFRTRIIPNGVAPDEFVPVPAKSDAADFVFVGELRMLKGVDLLLTALSRIDTPRKATAVIVGDGPDGPRFRELAADLGLSERVSFPGAMPARQAFALGRTLVMPSRAESFPYIVLEAGAAALPMIATSVGGIPEIVDGTPVRLVAAEDADSLHAEMTRHLNDTGAAIADTAVLQRAIGDRFTVEAMGQAILSFYRELTAA